MVIAIVLIVVAIVVVAFMVQRVTGKARPPKWHRQAGLEKIDLETLEIISLSNDDWKKIGKEMNAWKHPETGKYTMMPIMTCDSCGEQIPEPKIPPDGSYSDITSLLEKYVCPKCGKRAMGR